MFWKSITLDDYLPFSHSGNKHVKVVFDQPATAILGNNGSGKSSLLRAMTPYPAVRTDFGKTNGRIEKVLVHNGSIYKLTSDFKNNPTAPHSFKKDDVELNLSGTAETQKDLVEEHLGVTKLIMDILYGNIKVCALGKTERRSLFSYTYPSDLTFVLEYHKKICSDIRACSNQLKLLGNREATLRSYLISDEERARMERFRDSATSLIDAIDKTVLLLSSETDRNKVAVRKLEALGEDIKVSEDEMVKMLKDLTLRIQKGLRDTQVWRKYIQAPDERTGYGGDYNGIRDAVNKINSDAEMMRTQFNWYTEKAAAIRDELNKFETLKNTAEIVNEKSNMEARLAVIDKELSGIVISDGDMVPAEFCDHIRTVVIPQLSKFIDNFHMQNVKMQPVDALYSMQRRIDEIILTLSVRRDEIGKADVEIKELQSKIDRLARRPYPTDCTRTCILRDTIVDNINQLKGRLDAYMRSKQACEAEMAELEKEKESLTAIYTEQQHIHEVVRRDLLSVITNNGLDSVVFRGESPVDCLNDHPSDVVNRVIQACDLTTKLKHRNDLIAERETLRASLATLTTAEKATVSAEVITKIIQDKSAEHEKLIDAIDSLDIEIYKKNHEARRVEVLWENIVELDELIKRINNTLNIRRYYSMIEFNDGLVHALLAAKHDISEQLFSFNKTLDSQQKHKDVLELEILPTTEKIKKEKHRLCVVADALSPSKGLPCIHLTRFINRIISRANAYIKRVWLYDMEIVYLKEGEDLEFTFEVIIRGSTSVKDISVLSAGQQAIVNLAVTLAICTERHWFDSYPMMADEIDAPLIDEHRAKLVELLSDLIDSETVKQLILVNHYAMQTGMSKCDSVCLSTDGIVLPETYNVNCEIN